VDTSKEYRLMCCKASEIQKLWNPKAGDWGWHDNDGEYCMGSWEFPEQVVVVDDTQAKEHWLNYIWLPRQDQLQEMVFKDVACNGESLIGLMTWVCEYGRVAGFKESDSKYQGLSYEKLWLAFYMETRFNKVWTGNDWVKSEEGR
jgi:hypothetical protein